MNADPSKLRQQHREEEILHESQQTVREFSSVEEVIRYDREQTAVPGVLDQKLTESLAKEPKPARSWWRRLFG